MPRVGLMVVDQSGVRFIAKDGHRSVSTQEVESEKGMLASLVAQVGDEWAVVRAISFPHAPAAPKTPDKDESERSEP